MNIRICDSPHATPQDVATIATCPHDSPEARELMAEMWREVDAIYGNSEPTQPTLDGMETAEAVFLIARVEEDAVGCVALRPRATEIAEVKRMYVRPASRGTGVAQLLMRKLEEMAAANGFREIWLETGLGQPAAIRLYESLGYERIAGFGDYREEPDSVCYRKAIR